MKPLPAAEPLLLEVASDLTFLLEGFPLFFRQRIERFFYYFVGRALTPSKPPLRIVHAPVPASPAGPSLVTGPVEVRRGNGASFYEVAGLHGWCDADGSRAAIELDDPSESMCCPPSVPPRGRLEAFTSLALVAIIFELAAGRGWLGLHAAAVSVAGRGILLPGASGAGKTTIFGNAHRAGLGVLSDDLVWLRETSGGFRLHAFPRGLVAKDPPPEPTADDVAVCAIACPKITAQRQSRLVELPLTAVLEVLFAESGVLSLPAAGERFRALVRLARSVPGYQLETGSDRGDVAPLLATL